jgi:pyruvate/2-oxoglutarate/acetoin dehydrogenase E1 component
MREILFNAALNEAMHEEMSRDDKVYYIGEECAEDTWGTSTGLFEKFGKTRIKNTAISEAAILGSSVGAAMAGYRPVVNLMFGDFYICGADEVLNKAAKWRFANAGKVTIPLVIRAPIGGYSGLGPDHSQCLESLFMRTPGLKIAIPSMPSDAKGLLKTAIRDNNPVIFLEHKNLMGVKGPVPDGDYTVPFGVADIKRAGTDVTVFATGYMVKLMLDVARYLQEERGISAEIIDPRTLEPLDIETVIASIKKTKHLVIVDEDTMRCGVGAEIAMQVMENAFDYLDAPVKRVQAANYPIAACSLEKFILPQPQDMADAVMEVLGRPDKLDVAGKVRTASMFG